MGSWTMHIRPGLSKTRCKSTQQETVSFVQMNGSLTATNRLLLPRLAPVGRLGVFGWADRHLSASIKDADRQAKECGASQLALLSIPLRAGTK
jgi:hypothetical protein